MNKTLVQKSGFKTSTFSIEDTGLLIIIRAKHSETELHIPFEQIKTNRATLLDHNKGMLALGFVFAGIALFVFILSFTDKTVERVAVPLWTTISLILFVIYFKTRKKKLYLQTTENRTIEFLATQSNLDTINNFIGQLLTERNSYLISKYGSLNRNLEFGPQLENLNWLLNNRAISKTQYDEKVQELNFLFNSHLGNKPIGFASK